MNSHVVVDRFIAGVFAGVLALGVATAAPAESGRVGSVSIIVFDERYVSGERAFDDLDALEKYITAGPAGSVMVLVCGAKATRSLKAVVHRFRQYPVQIRVPDVDERDCMSIVPVAMAVRQRDGRRPYGIDDAAVDRYWLELMP